MSINERVRPALGRVVTPAGRVLARVGIAPDAVTLVGTLGVAAGALVFFPSGRLFVGTLVCTGFVLADMLDGAIARARGRHSNWGAFLDSTLDRVGDGAIFGGLVLWFAGAGAAPLLAALALFCLIAGVVVSYAKARAEGLGMSCDVGVIGRGERVFVALVATGLSGLGVPYVLSVGLWILAVGSAITVVQRFVAVHRQVRRAEGEAAPRNAGDSRRGGTDRADGDAHERADHAAGPPDERRSGRDGGERARFT